MQVSGSILGILEKNENKKEKIEQLSQTTCDYLHLDIIDGIFVEGKITATEELLALLQDIKKPFDVHLMVTDIGTYIDIWKEKQPAYITFHIEATENPSYWIQSIKHLGIKVGIAISPTTSISALNPYLDQIDLVLVMSIVPGKSGQSFIENSVDRIEYLQHLREENGYSYQIEVDGGINADTLSKVKSADIIVSASFITNAEDYQVQINQLKNKEF